MKKGTKKTAAKNVKTNEAIKVEVAEVVQKPQTIGDYIVARVKEKVGVKEIVAECKKKFPGCKTGVNSVYFYQSKVKRGIL